MIHLLVGSCVQKPDSSCSLIGRETILVLCCLLISCHISTRLPARSWSENEMVQTKRVNVEDEFVLVEAPTDFNYNSLKAECCYGEDVLAVKFSQRVS